MNEQEVASPVSQAATITPEPARTEFPRNALAEWAVNVLVLLFGTTNLVQAFVIPTGSMEDTLLVGDHVLVDKLTYAPAGPVSKYLLPYRDIQRGDIIVFRYPVDPKQIFVKRAIGLPGDRIRIENKQVFRNGVKLEEPYVYHKSDIIEAYRDNFPDQPYLSLNERAMEMIEHNVARGEVVVPANAIFAMGDNRDRSLDSRFWGFVPRENIIGKPLMVYWSYNTTTDRLTDPTISIRHITDLAQHFFTKTRWDRSFRLIHGYHSNN